MVLRLAASILQLVEVKFLTVDAHLATEDLLLLVPDLTRSGVDTKKFTK